MNKYQNGKALLPKQLRKNMGNKEMDYASQNEYRAAMFLEDWLSERGDIYHQNMQEIAPDISPETSALLLTRQVNSAQQTPSVIVDDNGFVQNGVIQNDFSQEFLKNFVLDNPNYLGGLVRGDGDNYIFYKNSPSVSTTIHERTHAGEFTGPEQKIQNILGNEYTDSYLDSPTEVYSRLMEFRHANKLDPKNKLTENDINFMKLNKDSFNIINRYDTNTLMQLFNDVASNETYKPSDIYVT